MALVTSPTQVTSAGANVAMGSSANRCAFVWQETVSATPTAPTINGVSMVQAGSTNTNFTSPVTRYGSMWYMVNPPSGTQAVSVGTDSGYCMVLDNVNQSNPIDAAGNIGSQSSGSCNVTLNTATADCWVIGGQDNTANTPSGSGVLTTGTGGGPAMWHSNGTVATGSISGGFTWAGGGTGGMNMVKVAPFVPTLVVPRVISLQAVHRAATY